MFCWWHMTIGRACFLLSLGISPRALLIRVVSGIQGWE